MKDKEQQETYQKYMTPAPIPDKILKTFNEKLSSEEAFETDHLYFKGMDAEQNYEKAGNENKLDEDYRKILFGGTERLCEEKDIRKIVFSDILNKNIETCDYRDISQEKDGSVIGWVEKQGENGYVLHIDGKGKICAPEYSWFLFAGFQEVEEIVFGKAFDTSNVKNMPAMFCGCRSLSELDVSRFDTSSVTNMFAMFYGCRSLRELDVSGFDTSSVTHMDSMFAFCHSLKILDTSRFDIRNVENQQDMFLGCDALPEKYQYFYRTLDSDYKKILFEGAEKLCEIDDVTKIVFSDSLNGNTKTCDFKDVSQEKDGSIVGWMEKQEGESILHISGKGMVKTGAPENCHALFEEFSRVKEIVCGNIFSSGNITAMDFMFHGCSNLKKLDVSRFDTSNVTDMRFMFSGCKSLSQLDVSGFGTSNVTNMSCMFYNCSSLVSVGMSGFDTSNVTSMFGMFSGCKSLGELDVSGFNTFNVTSMFGMFDGCENLSELDVGGFNTSNVTNMGRMFCGCKSLNQLDMSGFDMSNVTNMGSMFKDCSSLKNLDTSRFDMRNAENQDK